MSSPGNSRPLRIAQVAPLWMPVPPATYGGAELMVHWLTEELVRRGHRVTLFASGDSRTSADLEAVCDRNLVDTMTRGEAYSYEPYACSALTQALRRSRDFDVIHCHAGLETIPLSILDRTPVVHTLHTNLASVDERWLLERYPEVPIVAVSRSQIADLSRGRRDGATVIHHGCDIETYEPSSEPGEYLAYLGRMGKHKNPLGAIQLARSCDLPIVLAGAPQDRSEAKYFAEQVEPLIDDHSVVHLGNVGHQRKVELLKGASALVFPIQWDEPFGLVMIEAMACGTPVLALRRGSVPEVVDQGVTGYYASTIEELQTFVSAARALDRMSVWEQARSRFGHRTMVDRYEELFRRLAEGSGLSKAS